MHFYANIQKYVKNNNNGRIYVIRNVNIFNQNYSKSNVEEYTFA